MNTTPNLSPGHRTMLEKASGIAPKVIEARGYRTVTTKAELWRLGFAASQQVVPTLLIPLWNINGEIGLYHHRPDQPRIREGKPAKYEFPARSKMIVDVHPLIRDKVRDPSIPLFITEGCKKADAANSRGLCCIALIGVWNFRGANEYDGLCALPDWESIPFKDRHGNRRKVYLCYDSDVMEKPPVYLALKRLADFLRNRGAEVLFVYLPCRADGGKIGLDDYFVAGHTKNDLLSLATHDLRKPPFEEADSKGTEHLPYRETPNGLVWDRRGQEGTNTVSLTNFTARIVADVVEDDGVETRRLFTVEGQVMGKPTFRFNLAAEAFMAMNWPTLHLGAGAIIYPGQSIRENARTAIQVLSSPPETRVRTHTGWVKEEATGQWGYCHAGGIIRAAASDSDDSHTMPALSVRLSDSLSRFSLPEPPALDSDELREAFAAEMRLWDLGKPEIVLPVCAAVFRAVLGPADFSLFLAGPTGVFKSELAACVQQHFGAGMNARCFPANWSATDNFLEGLAFRCKDALLVIDEFVPRGSVTDQQRYHARADRVLRAQGNNAGRGRMRQDETLRSVKPPRGLILSTGEEIPQGQSLRARILILEVASGDVYMDRLTQCQKDGAKGLYALVMSAFLAWLAPRYSTLPDEMRALVEKLREGGKVQHHNTAGHLRTREITANLAVGMRYFLRFAVATGLLSREEGEMRFRATWTAIAKAATVQAQHHAANEPTRRFLELISAAIGSKRAHLADMDGDTPMDALSLGWREVGHGERVDWQPCGDRIGFVDEDSLYLLRDPAYQTAQRLAGESGDGIAVKPNTLTKRLDERGLLVTTEKERGHLTVRRVIGGVRHNVLHLRRSDVLPVGPSQSAQSFQD